MRGIVRAQDWAEAEKAKAQRNPAAMREHEQILGQAPRGFVPWLRLMAGLVDRVHQPRLTRLRLRFG